MKKIRRKLLAYTDLKSEVLQRKKQFRKMGATHLVLKKEYGGWALRGKILKKK